MNFFSSIGNLIVGSGGLGGSGGGLGSDPLKSRIGGNTYESSSPQMGAFMGRAAKNYEFLANPNDDYSSGRAMEIKDWSARQLTRLDAAYEAVPADDYDRKDEISDARSVMRMTMEKADSVLEGDKSLKESNQFSA